MKNIDLNLGGLIGAVVCGGIAATVVFSTVDFAKSGHKPFRPVIVSLIGGAFAGNYVWGLVFKKAE